jgi:hypothetical protein
VGATRSDVCHRRQLPQAVCQFARVCAASAFGREATFGKDTLVRRTFSGLRVHVRLEWPGMITRFCIAPANMHVLATLLNVELGNPPVQLAQLVA